MKRPELHPEMTEAARRVLDLDAPPTPPQATGIPIVRKERRGHRGRRPGPLRCVVQLRVRSGGKVQSFYSVTLHAEPTAVMKDLQELAERHGGRRGKDRSGQKGGAS